MNLDLFKQASDNNQLLEAIDRDYQWGISNQTDWENKIPTNFCPLPFTNLEITVEGHARPCCKYERTDGAREKTIQFYNLEELYHSEHISDLREQFMNNQRPVACAQCWREESSNLMSLRKIARRDWLTRPIWGRPRNPRYINFQRAFLNQPNMLDLKLSNLCNLKCRICGPWSSTQWISEYSQLDWADRKTIKIWSKNSENKLLSDDNRIILTQWADNIVKMEFHGGEPMMQTDHDSVLDILIQQNSAYNVTLLYNTNATVYNQNIVDRWNHYDVIIVNFSIDDIEQRFEYQRKNARYSEVIDNINKYKLLVPRFRLNQLRLRLYITVSLYNIYYLDQILTELDRLELSIFLNVLHDPVRASIYNLPSYLKLLITDRLSSVTSKINNIDPESSTIDSVIAFMNTNDSNSDQIKQFLDYNNSIDQLREESFKQTFTEFYELLILEQDDD